MAAFGADFGNLNSVVSVPKAGGITVIANEVSKRENSSLVSFGEKERYIGEKALDLSIRNWRNTATSLKRLVGIEYNSPAAEAERRYAKFTMREDKKGFIEVKAQYKFEERWFRPEQLVGMLFTQLTSYVREEEGGDKTKRVPYDVVVSTPAFYTVAQRRLLWHGLQIAGLNPLTLLNETTAAALDYGIYKTGSLPEKDATPHMVGFLDVGHSATTLSLVSFSNGQLKVIGHWYDRYLGGRDFDYALYEHFAKEVEGKHGHSFAEDKKGSLKMLSSCEKLKKVLSANAVASFSCELAEFDVQQTFNREQAEGLWAPLLTRFEALLEEAKKCPEFSKASTIELLGGATRIPCLKTMVTESTKLALSTTLNSSESVSKGCGIMAAMLSPKFKVRDFSVVDCNLFPIDLGYHSEKPSNPISDEEFPEINKKMAVLKVGDSCPKTLNLTFDRSKDFSVYVFYSADGASTKDVGEKRLIGKYKVGGIPELPTTPSVKVRLRLTPAMLVHIEGASITEDYEEEEEYEVPDDTKMEVDEEAPAQDGGETKEEGGEEAKTEKPPAEKKMKKEKRTVKKQRKHECTVDLEQFNGLSRDELKELTDAEVAMVESDLSVQATQEAKNQLESWIYDMRLKIEEGGQLFEFSQPDEREALKPFLTKGEDWLYSDGEDTSKDAYMEKLQELKGNASTILNRYQDHLDAIRKAKEEEERKKREEEERIRKEEEEKRKAAAEAKKAEEEAKKKAEEEAKAAAAAAEGGEEAANKEAAPEQADGAAPAAPEGDKMDLD